MNHWHEELIITAPPGGEVCKVVLIIRVEDANVDLSDENCACSKVREGRRFRPYTRLESHLENLLNGPKALYCRPRRLQGSAQTPKLKIAKAKVGPVRTFLFTSDKSFDPGKKGRHKVAGRYETPTYVCPFYMSRLHSQSVQSGVLLIRIGWLGTGMETIRVKLRQQLWRNGVPFKLYGDVKIICVGRKSYDL